MYLCVRVSLPDQESEWSCICVLGYRYQTRKVSGHVFVCKGIVTRPGKWVVMYLCIRISLPSLYQARKVSGHSICVLGYRYEACTKPRKCVVMYLCVRISLPDQESEWSCICVLEYRYQACTKPGKWVVVYLCIRVSLPSLYQARKVGSHVFVC